MEKIHKKHNDFNPPGLKDYISKSGIASNEEARNLTYEIQKSISEHVLGVLKETFSTEKEKTSLTRKETNTAYLLSHTISSEVNLNILEKSLLSYAPQLTATRDLSADMKLQSISAGVREIAQP